MNANDIMQQQDATDDWFVNAFGALYPIVYAHRTIAAAAPEARFAAHAVQLRNTDCALDLCCGTGRHLVTLQQFTQRLTGADYSPELLGLARSNVADTVSLVRADMRALPFHSVFDVVFSFFTSFGYFKEEEDNLRSALNMAQVLRPGGRFFLDYLNPPHTAKHLQAASERESQGCLIRERRWIDNRSRRINKSITVMRDGVRLGSSVESVRLYEYREIAALLERAGLCIERSFGDYSGDAYAADSPRMLLAGIRSAS